MAVASCRRVVRNLLINGHSTFRRCSRRFSDLDTATEVANLGYKCEVHQTTTDDGYSLTLHRITGRAPKEVRRAPVMIQHGLSCSSADWVIMEGGLVYRLADEGVDVWLGNTRGNCYSKTHVKHTPTCAEFWDYSWHEMGYYDLPAMIDYILNETEAEDLTYVGHSQGTCVFFVMASTRPEYNAKIRSMFALAPVAGLQNIGSVVLRQTAQWYKAINAAAAAAGVWHIALDTTGVITKLMNSSLNKEKMIDSTMIYAVSSLWGYPCEQVKPRVLDLWANHAKQGLTLKQLAHYSQSVRGDYWFHFYNYGEKMNAKLYGQPDPPPYPLHQITTPVNLIYGPADWLSHPDDVRRLYETLTTEKKLIEVPLPKYNHLDFCWSKIGLDDLVSRILPTT